MIKNEFIANKLLNELKQFAKDYNNKPIINGLYLYIDSWVDKLEHEVIMIMQNVINNFRIDLCKKSGYDFDTCFEAVKTANDCNVFYKYEKVNKVKLNNIFHECDFKVKDQYLYCINNNIKNSKCPFKNQKIEFKKENNMESKLKKCWDKYKKWENFLSCLEIVNLEIKEREN